MFYLGFCNLLSTRARPFEFLLTLTCVCQDLIYSTPLEQTNDTKKQSFEVLTTKVNKQIKITFEFLGNFNSFREKKVKDNSVRKNNGFECSNPVDLEKT